MKAFNLFKMAALPYILLYALALTPRLLGITTLAAQPDELHWVKRSRTLLHRVQNGELTSYSTHIGHPGVVPAIIMAGGQYVGRHIFSFGSSIEKEHLIESATNSDSVRFMELTASRITCALVSSLIAPLLFYLCKYQFGLFPALLASLLIALDPYQIARSRVAHLDTVLTVLVVTTVILYLRSVAEGKVRLKLAAGFFWGLSIATKPTALALIPAFILWKAIRFVLYTPSFLQESSEGRGKEAIIDWSDLWALFTGQLTFAAIYSRLWFHNSDYLHRLHVVSRPADLIYQLGICLSATSARTFLLTGLTLLSILYGAKTLFASKRRLASSLLRQQLPHISLLAGILLLALISVPQILENLLRFWYWTAGLSGEHHRVYGMTVIPPRWGYLGLLLSRPPSVAILSTVIGLVLFIYLLFQAISSRLIKTSVSNSTMLKSTISRSVDHNEFSTLSFVTLMIAIIGCWISLLSTSDKQAFRYALPIQPSLYVIAAFGLSTLLNKLPLKFSTASPVPWQDSTTTAKLTVFSVFTITLTTILLFNYPHYDLFFNNVTGGLKAALQRSDTTLTEGQNEVLLHLEGLASWESGRRNVGVLGDIQTLTYNYARLVPQPNRHFRLRTATEPYASDYIVVFYGFHRDHDLEERGFPVIYQFTFEGVALVTVYEVPLFNRLQPYAFNLTSVAKNTGRAIKGKRSNESSPAPDKFQPFLRAQPPKDRKGHLMFGHRLKVEGGVYLLSTEITVPNSSEHALTFPHPRSSLPVIELQLTRNCKRPLTVSDLSTPEKNFHLTCTIQNQGEVEPRLYWFGKVPVEVSKVTLQKVLPTN